MLSELRSLTGDLQKRSRSFQHRVEPGGYRRERDSGRARALDARHQHDQRGRAPHARPGRAVRSTRRAHVARRPKTLIDIDEAYRAQSTGVQGFEGVARSWSLCAGGRAISFLPAARADSELIRRNLAEVLLAQGYQDLTGQIIRSVMKLVEELGISARELMLSPTLGAMAASAVSMGDEPGHGPAVPGVAKGEDAPRARQTWMHCCRVWECRRAGVRRVTVGHTEHHRSGARAERHPGRCRVERRRPHGARLRGGLHDRGRRHDRRHFHSDTAAGHAARAEDPPVDDATAAATAEQLIAKIVEWSNTARKQGLLGLEPSISQRVG